MKIKTRKKLVVVKAAISAAFFFILFSFVQSNELASVFAGVDWYYLTLSFVLAFVMLMVSCMKWKVLLDASGKQLRFSLLMRIYLVGYFFSNLLPSTVGGDLIRSFYAGRLIENQAYAAASVFLERVTGMLFLLVLVIVAPLMQPELYQSPFVFIPAIAAALLLSLIFWLWKVKEPLLFPDKILKGIFLILNRWATRTNSTFIKRLVAGMEHIYVGTLKRLQKFKLELQTALTAIRRDRRIFVLLLLLTVAFYFLTWVNVYVSFLAFGVDPDFVAISALVPTIMFVGQVPLTMLGNLGFFESVFVFYFLQLQIPAAESLAMGLLLRVKMLSLGILGFFVYLSLKRGKNTTFDYTDDLVEKIEC